MGYISKYGNIQAIRSSVSFRHRHGPGITLISFKSGYYPELFSLLFGNVLTVTAADLWMLAAVMVLVLLFVSVFFKELLAISFDEELARANGLPVNFLYLGLLVSLALTVVASVLVVGVVLASALLVIPAAAVYRLCANTADAAHLRRHRHRQRPGGTSFTYHYDVPPVRL